MLASRFLTLALAFFLATLGLCASAHSVAAQEKRPADQLAIEQSIELGVKYLKKSQKAEGFWGDGGSWRVGYTSLAGIALIECGVPANDPSVKRAADVVRAKANDIDSPYELALAILFLDRLKDKDGKPIGKDDKRIIQWLAGRLIAGQMPSGGWGYKVPKYGERDTGLLLAALRKMTPPPETDETKPEFDLENARRTAITTLPGTMKQLPVLFDVGQQLPADPINPKDGNKRNDPYDALTDNSNTHFAMLGVWTARKHDVPTQRTLMLLNRRFRSSQGPGGTWSYDFVRTGADGSPAFACVALLGIAIGHVVDPQPDVKPEADPVIIKAFTALATKVGEPVGDTRNRPAIKDVGGLYYLWAMERILVLYDLRKLGDKDWYLWGAEILLNAQKGDGAWEVDGGYPGQAAVPNTCLALLFLRRANLTPDLSKQLVVDPGVLTKKTTAPKAEPPPPTPKVEPKIETPPPPKSKPKVEPKVEPKQPTVTPPAPEPEPTPTAPPKKSSSPVLWIVLGGALVLLLGVGLFFLIAKRGKKDQDDDDDDDDEKPKKKGKKAKGKSETTKKKKPKDEDEEDEEE